MKAPLESSIPESSIIVQEASESVKDKYEEDELNRKQTRCSGRDEPVIQEEGSPMLRGSEITYKTENNMIKGGAHLEKTPTLVLQSQHDEHEEEVNVQQFMQPQPVESQVLDNKSDSEDYESYSDGMKEEIVAEEVIRDSSEMRASKSAPIREKETYSSVVEDE